MTYFYVLAVCRYSLCRNAPLVNISCQLRFHQGILLSNNCMPIGFHRLMHPRVEVISLGVSLRESGSLDRDRVLPLKSMKILLWYVYDLFEVNADQFGLARMLRKTWLLLVQSKREDTQVHHIYNRIMQIRILRNSLWHRGLILCRTQVYRIATRTGSTGPENEHAMRTAVR